MSNKIIWHGHATFEIITPELNIFIDPWFEGNPSADKKASEISKAHVVLVTHDHGDHLGQAVDICRNTGAFLGAIVEVASMCAAQGVDQSRILNSGMGFNIGGTVEYQGVQITMTQAFHSCSQGACAGFIIRLEDGFTIYHAGDTGIFSSMSIWGDLFDIQLALLPTGGVFTMDSIQAAMACSLLKCSRVIPMHWGSFPVLEQDTARFKQELAKRAPETRCIDMAPGDTVDL